MRVCFPTESSSVALPIARTRKPACGQFPGQGCHVPLLSQGDRKATLHPDRHQGRARAISALALFLALLVAMAAPPALADGTAEAARARDDALLLNVRATLGRAARGDAAAQKEVEGLAADGSLTAPALLVIAQWHRDYRRGEPAALFERALAAADAEIARAGVTARRRAWRSSMPSSRRGRAGWAPIPAPPSTYCVRPWALGRPARWRRGSLDTPTRRSARTSPRCWPTISWRGATRPAR